MKSGLPDLPVLPDKTDKKLVGTFSLLNDLS